MDLLAYAAGFFDGEGCVGIVRRQRAQRGHYVRVLIVNTNKDVLEWFRKHFGGDVGTSKMLSSPANWKVRHTWRQSGGAAEQFLHFILPYLQVKRAQVELALKLPATKEYMPHTTLPNGQRLGRKLTPTSLAAGEELKLRLQMLNKKGRPIKEDTWTSQPESF